ncbi:MAG: hypothetical protein KDE27_29240 [Planctomycetes bacterium]|nr:hypothetical protein [Planctomycetota bacterium]
MRALGFLFLLILLIAVVGFWRGWFYVSSVEAGEGVSVVVDKDKLDADGRHAVAKAAALSRRAIDAIKGAAREVPDGTRELETELRAVDVVDRTLRVRVDGEDIDLTVPAATPIESGGRELELREIEAGAEVRLYLLDDGEAGLRLTRVEVL